MKKTLFWVFLALFLTPSLSFAMGREPKEKNSRPVDTGAPSVVTTSKNVEIYVTSWCGYCKKLEAFLKDKGISYTRYDIEADPHAAEVYSSIGGTGVPVARIGSDIVYGYDPDRILELL